MRKWLPLLLFAGLTLTGGASAQAPVKSAESAKTTWFFYTVQWGYQDEFLDLFARNHYPLLKALEQAGSTAASGPTCRPITETAGPTGPLPSSWWNRRTRRPSTRTRSSRSSIRTRRSTSVRRSAEFEILVAHWDVPLNAVDLSKR